MERVDKVQRRKKETTESPPENLGSLKAIAASICINYVSN